MDVRGQIQAKREAAAKARRIAVSLTGKEDLARVLAFAADLDAQADTLERKPAPAVSVPPASPTHVPKQLDGETNKPHKSSEDEP